MQEKRRNKITMYAGILLLILGVGFLLLTYFPFLKTYWKYKTEKTNTIPSVEISSNTNPMTTAINKETDIVFVDQNFGLYIPKINANAKVIPNVDPYNPSVYKAALAKGIAHAKGTSFPNESGNVFLFAHSAVNFYEQRKYNIYFYLLDELKPNDPIYVSYQGIIYSYKVKEINHVDPTDTKYLGNYLNEDTLTIMSCWPVGTNWKRIIVTAVRN